MSRYPTASTSGSKSRFIEMFGSLSRNEKNWPVGRMTDACTYISDGSHYSPPDDMNSDIPMLSVKDMDHRGFVYDDCKHLSQSEYEKLCQNGCKPLLNDVLVAKDGSYFKYIFPLEQEREQAVLSSIAILRPNSEKITPRFLCELLKSKEVLGIVEQHYLTGTAIRRVILKGFRDLKVFFPPLELQNEFEQIYNQADKSGFVACKSRFIEMFGTISDPKVSVKRLIDVVEKSGQYGSNTPATDYISNTPRYIRITDINDDGSLNNDVKSPSEIDSKYMLIPGDVVFARTGATVGKTYLHKAGHALYAGYLIKYHTNNAMLPDFLFAFTHSAMYKQWIAKTQKIGAQPNISATQYDSMPILVPSIAEQMKYVELYNQADKSGLVN